jgi:alpha-amylase
LIIDYWYFGKSSEICPGLLYLYLIDFLVNRRKQLASVVFYFQVHQPFRIKSYPVFSIGEDFDYFNEPELDRLRNDKILRKVAEKCYLPANKVLLDLLKRHRDFRVSFSFSGVILDQFAEFMPEVLASFQELVATGQVELLTETYHHSLASLHSPEEFERQIRAHQRKIKDVFDQEPTVFRNTELIYNNDLARVAEDLGFEAILAEGVEWYLGDRTPNKVYRPKGTEKIKLLLKNYRLSDDIAFRFSNRDWPEYPLTADKFANWVNEVNGSGEVVNLFMDYETFGEHQWVDTGIFEFLGQLPEEVFKHGNRFMTVSEAAANHHAEGEIDMPNITSWADMERDVSAWQSNPLQLTAAKTLFDLEKDVLATGDEELIERWRRLGTSDHFYYMSTKELDDGGVHKYFSPNLNPYEAYRNYMNVLHDLRQRCYISDKDNKEQISSAK